MERDMGSVLATKPDLKVFAAELRQEFKADMSDLRQELKADISDLRQDLTFLREDSKREFALVRRDLDLVRQKLIIQLGVMMAGGVGLLYALQRLA
jgi:hypothetical protein